MCVRASTVGSRNAEQLCFVWICTSHESVKVTKMTETVEVNVAQALALIDEGLGLTMSRDLMSTNEVADLLLDVRTLLASAPVDVADEALPVA